MYIAISKQQQGENFKGSVRDFVNYLDKENEDRGPDQQEHFFDQYNDRINSEEVISEIDNNVSKLRKDEPKFYSIVVSPSKGELRAINNDPEKLRELTGFHHAKMTYTILHSDEKKAHVLVEGTRHRADDSRIEAVDAIYILQKRNGQWKIAAFSGIRKND